MPHVNFLIYDTKGNQTLHPSQPYTKGLTTQPQHMVKNIDIKIHETIKFILNMYFRNLNVIF
jgi:hypothetical protein